MGNLCCVQKNDVDNINLELKPGKIIGLIGPPGSGKSTLANLIPRFYDVLQGEILINNIPLKKLNLDALRKRIGLVSQHTFLFNSTLKENIAYSRPNSDLNDVINKLVKRGDKNLLLSIIDKNNRRRYLGVKLN